MNKIVKLALILFLVSAVVAGVLGATYVITEPNITARNTEKTLNAYKEVTDAELNLDGAQTLAKDDAAAKFEGGKITKVVPSVDGSVYVIEAQVSGSQSTITLAVGVDKASGTTTGISIIKSGETSGLGSKASTPEFKDQFPGKDAGSVLITKEGGEVNAITGATITSKAVTHTAAAAIEYVMNLG